MSRLAVPQLLDAFEIGHAADFGRLEPARRHAFLKRLYKTLAAAVEPTRRELHLADGLELYFAARLRADGAAVDLPDADALKAAVLLSERTLVTFAFHDADGADDDDLENDVPTMAFGAGDEDGEERGHRVSAAEFSAFLALLCLARPAIEAGAVHVLPLFPGDRQHGLRFRHETVAAHLRDGEPAGDEVDAGAVPALRLPALSAVPMERVLALREEVGPAYALRAALAATLAADDGAAAAAHLRALDDAAAALGERLHETDDGAVGGVVLALPPHGPDAALAAEAMRAVLREVDGARRLRPLAAWRRVAAAELHLPWERRPAAVAAG